MKLNNNYFFVRHGESLKNTKNIASCWPEKKRFPLTRKGRKQIKGLAVKLKNKKIDLIFTSDLLRAKQTAEIVGKKLGLEPKLDKRLREINVGILNGRSLKEIGEVWNQDKKLSPLKHYSKRFKIAPPGGETYKDAEKRMFSFLKELNQKHKDKNILIISHARSITLLEKTIYNYTIKKFVEIILKKEEIRTGELRKII
jgi:broad specificity phosphatase PhoE